MLHKICIDRALKRFASLLLVSSFLMLVFGSQNFMFAASGSGLRAYGTDTIAGYSALLSTSKTVPNSEVDFFVRKPGGAAITVSGVTNESGVAQLDLLDFHTRRAGVYEVSAAHGGGSPGVTSQFTVYPDQVSLSNSTIVPNKTVAKADGTDTVYASVNLRDQYGNPFMGHEVKLISSRTSDVVHPSVNNVFTDANGTAVFQVAGNEGGIATLSAVDATSGTVLSARADVAFLESSSLLSDSGGDIRDFIPVAAAQGPLDMFEIHDLPDAISPNENVSFRVTAQDQDGVTVDNYTGTIHFSAEGDNSINVTLPEDYTFKAEDLGTHEFSLGLKFSTAGVYKIVVTDVDNTLIEGEVEVLVGTDGDTDAPGPGAGSDGLEISSPIAGTYSQATQTISGTAPAGATIKIFDNDQEIGTVQSTAAGTFTYQAAQLAEGDHSIYVATVDGSDTIIDTSDTVAITIDTSAPSVDDVQFTPSGPVDAGAIMEVKVYSEPNLSQVAIIFNQEIFDLAPSVSETGAYVATITAPLEPGEYSMDVLVIDELANEATFSDVASVIVVSPVTDVTAATGDAGTEIIGQAPSQVFGLIGFGSNERVTLVWEAAVDDGNIQNYRVYYGLDPLNLENFVDTFDPATTWYVPGLENGNEYYFAVSAIDDQGNESELVSEIVSAIPFTLEVEGAIPDRPEEALGENVEEAFLRNAAISEIPPEMVRNGPELLWLLAGTGIAGGIAKRLSKRNRRR